MSSDKNKQAFFSFLTKRKPQYASNIFWSLEKAEEYFKSCGALSGSMYEGLSLESLERLESIISKDNIFVKKHSGMFNYLKIGFSVLKEYVKADASNEKQVELFSDKSESNKDGLAHKSHFLGVA